ncbi:unnamed protein product [Amoebophrya sp. A120]|nr:unnamed protein product [Amoebophrya sp. A120]|eukprot:GSA120T00012812001.1
MTGLLADPTPPAKGTSQASSSSSYDPTLWEEMEWLLEPTQLITKHGFDIGDVVVFLGGVLISKVGAYACAVRFCCYWQPCRRFLTGTQPGRAFVDRLQRRHPYFIDWFHAKSQQWAERAMLKKQKRRERFSTVMRPFGARTSAASTTNKALDVGSMSCTVASSSSSSASAVSSGETMPMTGGRLAAVMPTAPEALHAGFRQAATSHGTTNSGTEGENKADENAADSQSQKQGHVGVGMIEAVAIFKCLWPFWFPAHMLLTFRLYCYLNQDRLEKQQREWERIDKMKKDEKQKKKEQENDSDEKLTSTIEQDSAEIFTDEIESKAQV